MADLWVFLHIVGVALFLLFHGVQVWAMFALAPAFPDRERIFDRAEQSRMAGTPMYVALGILVVFGVIAGIDGSWFSHGWWLWTSVVVLLLTIGAMSGMAGPYMRARARGDDEVGRRHLPRLRRRAGAPASRAAPERSSPGSASPGC